MLYAGVNGEVRTGVMLEMTEVAPCLRHFAPQNLMGTPEVEREREYPIDRSLLISIEIRLRGQWLALASALSSMGHAQYVCQLVEKRVRVCIY